MSDARANSSPILFDGLIVRGDGWTDGLAASGLRGIHVTAADWVADFAQTCRQVIEWNRILAAQADRLFPVRDAADVARIGVDDRLGVILGLQNAAPIESDLSRVELLWRLGIRVLQLTYNDANLVGDGCAEPRDARLTRLGRAVVSECNRLGVLVDLAHVGRRSALEAVELSSAPVAVTHSNRYALVPNPRNKPDEVLRAVAERGGVIGVTPWAPMCWRGGPQPGVAEFIDQLRGMVDLVGVDAVAIGTDLPAVTPKAPPSQAVLDRSVRHHPEILAEYVAAVGNTLETRYCRGLNRIDCWTDLPGHLADAGFDEEQARKLLGGNWLRLFAQVLDQRSEA